MNGSFDSQGVTVHRAQATAVGHHGAQRGNFGGARKGAQDGAQASGCGVCGTPHVYCSGFACAQLRELGLADTALGAVPSLGALAGIKGGVLAS